MASTSKLPDATGLIKNIASSTPLSKSEYETTNAFEKRTREVYGQAFGIGVPYVFPITIVGNDLYYDADKSQLIFNSFSTEYEPSVSSKKVRVSVYDDVVPGASFEASNAMGAKVNVETESGDTGHLVFRTRELGKHKLDNTDRIYVNVDSDTARRIKTADHMYIVGEPTYPYHETESKYLKATFTEPSESNVIDHEYTIKLKCAFFVANGQTV
ncbi:MAG: hypothetical protein JO290_06690, partial [Sphingomonadaceae bacterium]|nr:hypothetical protein [Sphingomonadaceae bacterium]